MRGSRTARRGLDFQCRRLRSERPGNIVKHSAFDIDAALVADLDRYFTHVAERRRAGPRSFQHQPVGARKADKIDCPCDQSTEVPRGHDQEKAHVPERGYGPECAQQSDQKEAPAKAEAQPLYASGSHAQWRRRKKVLLHYLGTSTELMISVST